MDAGNSTGSSLAILDARASVNRVGIDAMDAGIDEQDLGSWLCRIFVWYE
jgi:hypothetical protein